MPTVEKVPQSTSIWAAIYRALRVVVAMGLPYLISYLAGNPDPRWSALAPIIMGVAKYLRDNFPQLGWLPV
jgi:uncharacterized membrane protein YccC